VVECSAVVAAPYVGRILGELGAEVVKLEPLAGDFYRKKPSYFLTFNAGKRSVRANLQTTEGHELARRLLRTADIFLHNWRPGVAERIGLGHAELHRELPDLIYTQVSAFGSDGPYAQRPGFDGLAQALTGVAAAQGGGHNPPTSLSIPLCDIAAGMAATAATVAAVLRRARGGGGALVETSLLRAGAAFTADRSLAQVGSGPATKHPEGGDEGPGTRPHPSPLPGGEGMRHPLSPWERARVRARPRPGSPSGEAGTRTPTPSVIDLDAGQWGFGPAYRIYPTTDGWVFVSTGEEGWPRLCAALGLVAPGGATALEDAVERALATLTSAEVVGRLGEAGVTVQPVRFGFNEGFPQDPQVIAQGLAQVLAHPIYGDYRCVGPAIRLSRTPPRPPPLAPALGADTAVLLAELGYTPDKVADLAARRVIGLEEPWPPPESLS
jgi:crotonobetainyl-CoA:carnitine CoA-transferase CaiB-like acyl-CoA transferase